MQYRVSGPESDQVRAIAFRVAQVLGADAGAGNVNYDWIEPARTLGIRVDQDQARLLGLSSQAFAQALNTVVSGITSTQMRSGIYLVDVVVRASADQRMSLSTIRTLQVPLPDGRTVPLSQFATVDYGQEYPLVWRRDRLPTLTVQADLAPGVHAATVVQALTPTIETLMPACRAVTASRRRHRRGERQGAGLGRCRRAADAGPHPTVLMVQLQSFHRLFLVLSVARSVSSASSRRFCFSTSRSASSPSWACSP